MAAVGWAGGAGADRMSRDGAMSPSLHLGPAGPAGGLTDGTAPRDSLDDVTSSQRPEPRRVLVIIPAWNEEATLAAVVEETRAALLAGDVVADILVVDDGSDDATRRVAETSAALVA